MTLLPLADDPLVAALAREGARYDAERRFPTASIALLREAGLHRRFAPPAAGGEAFADERARHAAMLDQLRRVGRGDLSVGRLYEGHVNALLLFGWYADAGQLAWLADALDRGGMFGVWATEPAPGVSLHGHTLAGAKSFASGAGGIDHAIVTATVAASDRRLVVVDAADPARTDASGWQVRGMRASVSGTYDLTGMAVNDGRLLGDPGVYDREPRFTAGAWRFAATQLGGIEALLAATRDGLNEAARADPLVRANFGAAIVATRSALAWVREAAREAADESAHAIPLARMTRGVVERAGLDVMEHAARLLGTRSAFEGRADKIIRDLSLYLRQAGPDHARDAAVVDWLVADRFAGDALW
jgi:alkylation response protein AidB-like acyl-CoA dehydrogenase